MRRFREFCVVGWLCFGLVAGATAAAEFTRLDLLDGRTLREVSVRSYDAATDRVLLLSAGKAVSIPVRLIPPPFAEQFRTRIPPAGQSVSSVKLPPPPSPAGAAPVRPTSATRSASSPEAAVSRHPNPAAPAPLEIAPVGAAEHARLASTRARRFFRYEFKAGSDSIRVTVLDVDIASCEPIEGWKGRFRSEGHAFLEFFDSKGRSFQRSNRGFEVITEEPKQGKPLTVVDFSQK
jgi:hypothetical protein